MPRLTLRRKIMACCIGLVAILVILVVVFVRHELSETLLSGSLTNGRNLIAGLAARGEHSILTEDYVSLLEMVRSLKGSDPNIAYVYVRDHGGTVLAHTFAGGFPSDLAEVNTPAAGAEWSQVLLDTVEEGPVYDIAVPISHGRVGFAHVGIWLHRIQDTISHFTVVLIVIAGAVLAMAIGLASVVSWIVTQPVQSLIQAAEKIRDGHLGHQVMATSKDEIGKLMESFNRMSDELLKQHRMLDDRNRLIHMAKEQAAGERDKLRAIIDSMAEGVVFVNSEGRITLCNESAERIWQKKSSDLIGRPLLECHPPQAHGMVMRVLAQAEQKPGFAVAQMMAKGKGHRLSSYSSVHSEDGRYLGLVLLTSDISERVALEQEQKRLREELFQQEKMALVGQIAASIAHELNTPLGTILLRAQLVRHEAGKVADLPDLRVIESEAQRCRRITDTLLGFSRRSEGVAKSISMRSLIQGILALVEHDLVLKGISLSTEYTCDGTAVYVDSNQVQQVLLNLVTNAADAMPGGGSLQISTGLHPEQGLVEIQVSDSGHGMIPEVLSRAFEPFFTTKESGKGTGLGLAICRRIVEEHEGKIQIQSRPGQGTTVSIFLPYTCEEAAADE